MTAAIWRSINKNPNLRKISLAKKAGIACDAKPHSFYRLFRQWVADGKLP